MAFKSICHFVHVLSRFCGARIRFHLPCRAPETAWVDISITRGSWAAQSAKNGPIWGRCCLSVVLLFCYLQINYFVHYKVVCIDPGFVRVDLGFILRSFGPVWGELLYFLLVC